ncbi:MAG: hypothetical protein H8D87_21470 [Deltaproteobacteria bacterium]|nr:hypothetical protein [Candidatus Desulfobacula maris]
MNLAGWKVSNGDANHIAKILRATPEHCWPFICRKYNGIKKKKGRREANLYLLDLFEKTELFEFKLGSEDQAIKDRALNQSRWAKRTIARASSEQLALETLKARNRPANTVFH